MTHLLLTNDYPPKVGGIQTYLWELWRRLPPDQFSVLTSPHDDTSGFDNVEKYRIDRYDRFWLPPTRRVLRRARRSLGANAHSAAVIDPAFPLGFLGPSLGVPYGVIVHGAEVTVPARLPGARQMLQRALRGADCVISSGGWVLDVVAELVAPATVPGVFIPPGVDLDRFSTPSRLDRQAWRRRFGLDPTAPLVLGVSRLVPRKGFDVLIKSSIALAKRHTGLQVVIAGTGRDEPRLRRLIGSTGAPVKLIGFVPDDDLPQLYGCADAFAMLCRSRWGGLEQEGFGIVFVEAGAAGCPQVAGNSGGAAEAVSDGETGTVVADPTDVDAVSSALDLILSNPDHRDRLGLQARRHVEAHFGWDRLAQRLADTIATITPEGQAAAGSTKR